MALRFQYASDLHLEFYNENMGKIRKLFVEPLIRNRADAEYLLLAGDIGSPRQQSYKQFLSELAPHYRRIFVTTGNHEYYKMPTATMTELDDKCREACAQAGENIVFLQNESYDINDWLSIYGGTFWTDIPSNKKRMIESTMNDYKYIMNFSAEKATKLHKDAVSGLEDKLVANGNARKWIVMSHHMPSFELIDEKYKTGLNTYLNYAFATDINIATYDRICAWVYGHTHTPRQVGKFYCNSYGYPGEMRFIREWGSRQFQISPHSEA